MSFLSGRVAAGLGLAWLSQQPPSIFLPGWTWIPLSIHKWSGSTSSTCWVCVLLWLRLQMNSDVVIHGIWIGPSHLEVKGHRAKLLLHLPTILTTSVRINFFIKGQNLPFGEYCCFVLVFLTFVKLYCFSNHVNTNNAADFCQINWNRFSVRTIQNKPKTHHQTPMTCTYTI